MEPLRRSIKEPITAIFDAWELLTKAADAHLGGDFESAEAQFREADLPEVWHWVNPASGPSPRALLLNVKNLSPQGDSRAVPISERDPNRHPKPEVKAAVLARDGHRCRYCGIPVIGANIRKIARSLYPKAIPWIDGNEREQHAAFQCFWLQYDHVVPHSHGGSSAEDNIVVTCCLCNYGKDKYTLRQLDIADPRDRQPELTEWDGLERLLTWTSKRSEPNQASKSISREAPPPAQSISSPLFTLNSFFVPGARISKGYLYTPPIEGKERWFKLGAKIIAEPTMQEGVVGCRLSCELSELQRRGLSFESLKDSERRS